MAERSRSVAARILQDLGVAATVANSPKLPEGTSIEPPAAISLVNQRVNEYIGIDAGMRSEITADQAVDAYDQL